VGAVAALGARHDGMITATLAIQDDLPEWLRVTALGDVAGDTACRRYGVSAERCGPGAWSEGAAGRAGICTAVWFAVSRPTAFERGRFPPDGRQGHEWRVRRGYRAGPSCCLGIVCPRACPRYSLLMGESVRNSEPSPTDQIGRAGRRAARRSTRVSAKHQVTIPAPAFEGAGLAVGDRLKAKPMGAGKVLLERVESSVSSYAGVLTGVWDNDELERLRNEWD